MDPVLRETRRQLREHGFDFTPPLSFRPVGGGCINESGLVVDRQSMTLIFLKIHHCDRLPNFEAEAAALRELADSGTLRVPRPLFYGTAGAHAFLALEALELGPPKNRLEAEQRLGKQLADLHRVQGDTFGWHTHNVIGDTRQINTPATDWIRFLREHRLGFQIELARSRGLSLHGTNDLLDHLPAFFPQGPPPPSLLHGDLWTGNIDFTAGDQPVIFDPATYYGDRETDVAFTAMFGGLSKAFYQAYEKAYPMPRGHERRRELYNLYHLLNHFNLFGGHYGRQAQQVIDELRAE